MQPEIQGLPLARVEQRRVLLRLLGIDPGSLITGYGVIEGERDEIHHIASGGIRTKPSMLLPERLKIIYDGLTSIIREYQPQVAAIESIFHSHNAQSALKLGHARGVALLAMVNAALPIAEYPPTSVKKAVAGAGRADKEQIQRTVEMILHHKCSKGYDASDALAVAICHFFNYRWELKIQRTKGGR